MSHKPSPRTYVARRVCTNYFNLLEAETGRVVRSVSVLPNSTVLVNGKVLQVTEPSGRMVLTDISSGTILRTM